MTLTEETQKSIYSRTKTNTQTRTGAPLPLAMPERRLERKGSDGIAGELFRSGTAAWRCYEEKEENLGKGSLH
jgi:hypothetical protein